VKIQEFDRLLSAISGHSNTVEITKITGRKRQKGASSAICSCTAIASGASVYLRLTAGFILPS
jgi:hypothetical protein